MTGGVGLPEPILTLADGTILTGQAACNAMDSESKDLKVTSDNPHITRMPDPSALTLSEDIYTALRHPELLTSGQAVQIYPPAGLPGTPLYQVGRTVQNPTYFPATYDPSKVRPTEWRTQYDRRYMLQLYTGDNAPGSSMTPSKSGGGGFYPNIHNNYIRTVLHRTLGKVAVVKGRMATSPATFNHSPTMGGGQLRYTSFCMNESVRTTRVMKCAFDERIPADSHGYFTIVVSRAEDRPANATTECGVVWVEWSPNGDGDKDPDFGWFQIRNMLPDPSYSAAVQNLKVLGDELATMGEYLPNVVYYQDQAAYEALGCASAHTK